MKCQGRPNGPCPDGRNDSSVHSTIGDLFLCNACEEYRWPTSEKLVPENEDDDSKRPAAKKLPATGQPTAQSKSAITKTNKTSAQQQARQESARPGRRRLARQASDLSDHSDEGDCISCAQCMLPLNDSGDQHTIKCDVCQSGYHQRCTSIPVKTLDALIKIKMHTGWVCEDCREFVRSRSQSLQSAMAALTEELATVKTELIEIKQQAVFASVSPIQQPSNTPLADEVAAMKAELADLKQQIVSISATKRPPIVTDAAAAVSAIPTDLEHQITRATTDDKPDDKQDQRMRVVIHQTLRDAAKRKRNIVVTGMPEEPATNDRETFTDICERCLSTKPFVVSCERLGAAMEGRNRKLLVRLTSDAAATELLQSAHQLHRAADQSVSSIYFNPDLSPAEAKLAFEERKRRRERTAQRRVQSRSSVELRKTSSEFAASLLPPHTSGQSGFDLVGNHNDIASADDTVAAARGGPVPAAGVVSDSATSNTTRASFLPR